MWNNRLLRCLATLALACTAPCLAQPVVPAELGAHADVSPPTRGTPVAEPGYTLFEGDIEVRTDELQSYLRGDRSVFGEVTLWDPTVPFDFDVNVSAMNQSRAIAAMNLISSLAGVTFRPATTNDNDRIRFNESTGNSSPVGRRGGAQIIKIFNWNEQTVICHEIFHSLGFWHEQSAPNRDDFITVHLESVCGSSDVQGDPCNAQECRECSDSNGNFGSCAHNFERRGSADVYGPYDFDSMMHYGSFDFSCNGMPTITINPPWNSDPNIRIGQRTHISLLDGLACRGLYPFQGDTWLRAGASGVQLGWFQFPFHDGFENAVNGTPINGTLLVDPGTYEGVGSYNRPMTIRGTYSTALIGIGG